jgi:hypothetical protein
MKKPVCHGAISRTSWNLFSMFGQRREPTRAQPIRDAISLMRSIQTISAGA